MANNRPTSCQQPANKPSTVGWQTDGRLPVDSQPTSGRHMFRGAVLHVTHYWCWLLGKTLVSDYLQLWTFYMDSWGSCLKGFNCIKSFQIRCSTYPVRNRERAALKVELITLVSSCWDTIIWDWFRCCRLVESHDNVHCVVIQKIERTLTITTPQQKRNLQ